MKLLLATSPGLQKFLRYRWTPTAADADGGYVAKGADKTIGCMEIDLLGWRYKLHRKLTYGSPSFLSNSELPS